MVKSFSPGWPAISLMNHRGMYSVFEQMSARATTRPSHWRAVFCLPKLGHNLFRGALIACVLVDCQPGALAKDDVISVQLFEAHRPVRQVQIRPPFEIVQSGTVSLVTRPVRLEAEQGQLYIRNANKKRRPLNPPFFIRGSG